jgi:hypothetical protein
MASETPTTAKTPMEEAFLRRLIPEEIPPASPAETGNQPTTPRSPVDVILAIREDMARFQKVSSGSSKQEFRESLRATMKAACMDALQQSAQRSAAAAADAADGHGQKRPGGRGRPSARRPDDTHGGGIPVWPNIEPILEYLKEREASRPKLSRAQVRRLAKSVLREMEAKKGPSEKQSSKKEILS